MKGYLIGELSFTRFLPERTKTLSASWGWGVILGLLECGCEALAGRAPLKVCAHRGQWVQKDVGGAQTWWAVGGLAETLWTGLLASGTLAL